ncbi:MAG TPA: hypothetical protein VJ901_01310 [Thermoanaerobaculia bacterium]|nr:hypothetical protein [Thermoanaerobaculia bacterium]
MPTSGGTHRVVLVRADFGANLNGNPIPPHVPMLRINPLMIAGMPETIDGLVKTADGAWRLCGVRLTLEGANDDFVAFIDDIPHLGLTDDSDMPAVSGEVRTNGDVACYFDVERGRLRSAETEHKALKTILTVDDVANPALVVTRIWDKKQSRIHLKDNARIDIEHTGIVETDTDMDFLMHYRVFVEVHPKAFVPHEAKHTMNRPPGSVSIGCSNSQWP